MSTLAQTVLSQANVCDQQHSLPRVEGPAEKTGQVQSSSLVARVDHLSLSIGSSHILRDVSLDIRSSERVGLIGSSGSGKSMLIKAMMAMPPAASRVQGQVSIMGRPMLGVQERQVCDVRGRVVSWIAQHPMSVLHPMRTIGAQLSQPLTIHYQLSAQERHERVLRMLERVGLGAEFARAYPHQLSGGQAQRAAIGMALITAPRLILADEPTSALDAITQLQIVKLLVELVDDMGASLLFVTHDFSVLNKATQRCYVMDQGMIVDEGRTIDLLASADSSDSSDSHVSTASPNAASVAVPKSCTLSVTAASSTSAFATPPSSSPSEVTRSLVAAARELSLHGRQ